MEEKYLEWSKEIRQFIENRKGLIPDLDTVIGCNGHIIQIIPLEKHFNNRLCRRVTKSKLRNTEEELNEREIKDLHL